MPVAKCCMFATRIFRKVNKTMLKKIIAAALLTTSLCSIAYADTKGPIRSVTLSSGGLAEIHRTASIKNNGKILIEVPLDQVDDILKSLIVKDKQGTVRGISLAGPQPVEETFRTLPFSAGDLQSLPQLLANLQGAKVSVTSAGQTLEGKVLGVSSNTTSKKGAQHILSLLTTSGKLTSMPLEGTTEVLIEDAGIQAKIAAAVEAAGKGKSDGSRTITIEMDGKSDRDVDISYVVSAPVWKTAYRVVVSEDGKARIQSWAVLENASGEDWNAVSITLASGAPVTLKQRLHERVWKDRAEVAINTAAGVAPRLDVGQLSNRDLSRVNSKASIGAIAMAAPAMAFDETPANYEMAMADTSKAVESDIATSFVLNGTHDVTNGDTLSVPIIDQEVDAEILSVYTLHQASNHPVASIGFKNSTGAGLPSGILTVYDKKNGYAGDAQLPSIAPDETRFASFATDKKVAVVPDLKSGRTVTSVKVVDGIITTSGSMKNETTYRISTAPDADRNVVIEHPKQHGWTFKVDGDFTETATHYRIRVTAAAGKSTMVKVIDELPLGESFTVSDLDSSMIAQWANDITDEILKSKLDELSTVKQKQMAAQFQVEELNRQIEGVYQQQDRIRKNLTAVPTNSDMHKNYLKALEESEAKLRKLETDLEGHISTLNNWKTIADDVVRTF